MPELPEVETTLLGIKPHILHHCITDVILRRQQLRWPIPQDLPTRLQGQTIVSIARRGKYLAITTTNGTVLIHLGMSGRLSIVPLHTSPAKHDHIDILFEYHILRYTDPRRFGAVLWVETDAVSQHPLLSKLGIEPLDPKFDGPYLWHAAQKRSLPIKSFIMDQHIVVGVGNIYATEALFMTGIHPATPTKTLSLDHMDHLAQAIQSILRIAIQAGGTSLKDFLQADGKPGYFKLQIQIYGRDGHPCPQCQTRLEKISIGQRTSTYCPACQPISK